MNSDNIAAISTALGVAGVAVIRVSGSDPLSIAKKIFKPYGKTEVANFEPNKMYVGEFCADDFSDECMCVYFKAPKSFTGEDVVEFHTHGGIAIVKGVLEKILNSGARLAERGEFTKRAFMNGKLSLSSAEGLIDMINSESVGGVKAGFALYRERLTAKINDLQNILLDAISQIDVDMDFPEEDVGETSRENVKKDLEKVVNDVDNLIASYKTGRVLKNGVKVAICGKPNTGKSSLLNALLSYEKAIVSGLAGTTRDIVEGSIDYNGIRFNLFDTAGIRETKDEIENIGVELSNRTAKASDIVLFVVDADDFDNNDKEVFDSIKDLNHIVIENKTDKSSKKIDFADIRISAKTGENIEKLKSLMYEKTVGVVDSSADYLCEERHLIALKTAKGSLISALNIIATEPLDIIAIDIKNAWTVLGEITGKTATEEIIDNIFNKFCVGK